MPMFRRLRRFWYLRYCLGWELALEQTFQEVLIDAQAKASRQADRPRPTTRDTSVARAL